MNDQPPLAMLHLQGGGCGGCGLEFEALLASGALDAVGLRLVESPRHADLLLVSGSIGRSLMQAVDATWSAMAKPKWLVTIGACAQNGGPFGDSYAVSGGIGTRLPVALAIPGSPPAPDALLAGLRLLLDAIRETPADATASAVSPQAPPALLPAAPRHPPAGDDSSAG